MFSDSDIQPVKGTGTCENTQCKNYGKSFPGDFYPNPDGVYRGHCGICGQPTKVEINA